MNSGRCIGLGVDLVDHEVPLGVVALVICQRFGGDLLRVGRLRDGPTDSDDGVCHQRDEAEDAKHCGHQRPPIRASTSVAWPAAIRLRKLVIIILSRVGHTQSTPI
jgi:hypothetical protein